VDHAGHERTQAFDHKIDAQAWLNEITAKLTHRHLRCAEGWSGNRGRGVRLVVGVARSYLGEDGSDPQERVG
jgi:hypothetical protein